MKLCTVLLLAMALAPGVAAANAFDTPGPPLDELLARARAEKKPLLLDFSAVWCGPCKMLHAELDKPENQKRLGAFIYHTYDAERGNGAAAAARYAVQGFPTLVVVDDKGTELGRQLGFDDAKLGRWLEGQVMALRSEPELEAQVKAKPDDIDALWLLARRAQARDDQPAARAWLAKIEAADKSETRDDAATAGWMRLQSELDEKVRKEVREKAAAYLDRYPAQGEAALKALAASGADKKTLDAALTRMVAGTKEAGDLNNLAYLGLSVGALNGALAAAEKQVVLAPQDAGGLDTLAEVLSYRGDRARAVETAGRAIELAAANPSLAAALRGNLERYKTGAPSPDVAGPGTIASPLVPTKAAPGTVPLTAEAAAQRLYSKNAARLAAACGDAAKGRGLDEIYLRVHVGPAKVDKVEVLEPTAPTALKKCLDKAVRGIAVPADQKPVKVTVPIKLS